MKQYDKNKQFFITETSLINLKMRSIRGGIYTMCGEWATIILRLGYIAVIARILIPEDFGIVSMVTALTVIAERFRDLGLASATIQKEDINHAQVSAIFWINVIFGTLIMIVLCAFSKVISWFYAENNLVWVTIGISVTFFFGGMSVQHQTLLRRRMEFFKLAAINIVADILSMIISIILAFKGYAFWALVWKEIFKSAFVTIGTWLLYPWIPIMSVRNANIAEMIRFGRDITGFNLINFFTKNLDQILIGKFCGPEVLGLFRQSYQLILVPIGQIGLPVQNVSEPALSKLQSDPIRYRQYYRKILTLLSFATMPLVVFLFMNSKNIILLLLGEKWLEAEEIFRIFAVAAFIIPIMSTTGHVMVSCGKTKRYFFIGLTGSIIHIFAISIGISWGALGIAIANALSVYIYFVPLLFISFRETPVNPRLFLSSILPAVISSLAMGGALFLSSGIVAIQNSLYSIIVSLTIGIFVYLFTWCLIPGGGFKLKEFFLDLRFSFQKV